MASNAARVYFKYQKTSLFRYIIIIIIII
jgi:hypothetical protein